MLTLDVTCSAGGGISPAVVCLLKEQPTGALQPHQAVEIPLDMLAFVPGLAKADLCLGLHACHGSGAIDSGGQSSADGLPEWRDPKETKFVLPFEVWVTAGAPRAPPARAASVPAPPS